MPYSTPADVTTILNQTWDTSGQPTTAQVTDMILRADDNIDQFSGHNWLQTTLTNEYYDGIGYGPRKGMILLKNSPVTVITTVQYYDGAAWQTAQEGKPNDFPSQQTYETYLDQGKIIFYRLSIDGPKRYRVTYTYGYATVPNFIRDLSATLAALDVLGFKADTFAEYHIGDLRVWYPFGFKTGAQHKLLVTKANRLIGLAAARRGNIGTG